MKKILLSAFLAFAFAADAEPRCRTLHPDPDALRERCERFAALEATPRAGTKAAMVRETQLDVIDILVGYDLSARKWLADNRKGSPEAFASAAVAEMNECLRNTGLRQNFHFRLAGIVFVDVSATNYIEDTLYYDLVDGYGDVCHKTGEWAKIAAKREEVGADIVSLWVDAGDTGLVGIGYSLEDDRATKYSAYPSLIPGFGDWAYNVCSISCVREDLTALHEIGHNMGCGHADRTQVLAAEPPDYIGIDPGPQLYGYSSGYHFTAGGTPMHTVMAYSFDGYGGYYELAPVFSSPRHTYRGVTVGDEKRDNTRTLLNTFKYVAQYRVSKLPPDENSDEVAFGVVWPEELETVTNAIESVTSNEVSEVVTNFVDVVETVTNIVEEVEVVTDVTNIVEVVGTNAYWQVETNLVDVVSTNLIHSATTNEIASGAAFAPGGMLALFLRGASEGGRVFYTLDGSSPTESSTEYFEGDLVPLGDRPVTVKAISVRDGLKSRVFTCALECFLPAEDGWFAATDEMAVSAGQMVSVGYVLPGDGRGFRMTLDGEEVFSDDGVSSSGQSTRNAEFVAEKSGTLRFWFRFGDERLSDGFRLLERSAKRCSMLWPHDGAFSAQAARVYDGFLLDGEDRVKGTLQVKVGKAGKDGRAKLTATVVPLGAKKLAFKGETVSGQDVEMSEKGGNRLKLTFGASGMFGEMGANRVEGALTDAKSSVLAGWNGQTRVFALKTASANGEGSRLAWGYSGLSAVIGAKGKAKVSGMLADGTKVSVATQLLLAEGGAVLPVAVPLYSGKTGGFGLMLTFDSNRACEVSGMTAWDASRAKTPFVAEWDGDVAVAGAGNISGTCFFRLDADRRIESVDGAAVVEPLLPDGEKIGAGAKWTFDKAGKVSVDKNTGTIVYGANPSALKLSYTPKTGAFKGSFKVYAMAGGKLKKISATVTGTVVGGVGYGTALVGKKAAYPVTITK